MNIRLRHGSVEIEFMGLDGPEEAWSMIGQWQHIFLHAAVCGKCGSDKTYLQRRDWDKGDDHATFFSAVCFKCTAKLDFWPPRDGRGFEPKLKDRDKNIIPDSGWVIYVPRTWGGGGGTPAPRISRSTPKHDEDTMHRDGSELKQEEIPFSWAIPIGAMLLGGLGVV